MVDLDTHSDFSSPCQPLISTVQSITWKDKNSFREKIISSTFRSYRTSPVAKLMVRLPPTFDPTKDDDTKVFIMVIVKKKMKLLTWKLGASCE